MTSTSADDRSYVLVFNGQLVAQDYRTTDAAVVNHFKDLTLGELGPEFERCLALGVRVAEVAVPSLDTAFVRHEFDGAVDRQRQLLIESSETLKRDVSMALDPIFGADGALPAALRSTREELERELTKYFDESSAKSFSATVSKRVEDAVRAGELRLERSLNEAFDLTDENRGIGKVYRTMRTEAETVSAQLADLIGRVSAVVARKDERESSPRKGVLFEEDVFLEIARIASLHGDAAESTGTLTGDSNRRRGDAVVTLDAQSARGADVRFTFEVMDRATGSQKSVLRELDEAKANRNAVAAIAVLSYRDAAAACGQVLQRLSGGRFICVLDKDKWDPLPLELAYSLARIEALRAAMTEEGGAFDTALVSGLIEEAVRELAQLNRVRARLSASREGLKDADALIVDIEANLRALMTKIAGILTNRQ